MSTDKARYFMNGIFFAENGDIVATDGRCLAMKKTGLKFHNTIIKPEIFKFFGKADIYVRYNDTFASIELNDGKTKAVASVIDERFPNYNVVFPKVEKPL